MSDATKTDSQLFSEVYGFLLGRHRLAPDFSTAPADVNDCLARWRRIYENTIYVRPNRDGTITSLWPTQFDEEKAALPVLRWAGVP